MESFKVRQAGSNSKTMPEMERTMMITSEMKKIKESMVWGCINAAFCSLLIYDLMYSCPFSSSMMNVAEYVLTGLSLSSTIFHFCRYMWISWTLTPVALHPRQKTLLGVQNSDYYFKTATPIVAKEKQPVIEFALGSTPMNYSATSWRSSSMYSQSDPNENVSYGNLNSKNSRCHYDLLTSSPEDRKSSYISGEEVIASESSLNQYLNKYEAFEKSSVVESSMEQPSNMLSGFWNYPATRNSTEVSPLLRRCNYQISISPAQAQNGLGPGDKSGSLSPFQSTDVWRRNKINPSVVIEWTANLRMWICQTILERLVSEIEHIDTSLHNQGLVDVTIGVVGLERLKKTAQIPQVMLNIPSLSRLVPFLEISQNQEYVVSRIKDLARGGSMSEYQWNSGGKWEGKDWTSALPTDAALVLHLFATYLDSQLPQTSLPDNRPFSSQHVVRLPDKPTPGQLCIVETSTSPPNYQLQAKTELFSIPKGRSNLFFTILLFLHMVKTKDHGILGRMNLGGSGINLLWVIDSENSIE